MQLQTFVNELVSQSTRTGMIVNGKKTKEMLIGQLIKSPSVPLLLNGTVVDRVSTFKLSTFPMIWNGQNTLMQSCRSLHRVCITWNIETCRIDFQWPDLFLLYSYASCEWICKPSLALQPDRVSVWHFGVTAPSFRLATGSVTLALFLTVPCLCGITSPRSRRLVSFIFDGSERSDTYLTRTVDVVFYERSS